MKSAADLPNLTLANIANGAAVELFESELSRVVENILDPNTDAETKRSITLKVTILPDIGRKECSIKVEASSKIAANQPCGGVIFVGKSNGVPCAVTMNQQQEALGFDADTPKAVPIAPAPRQVAKA